MKYIINTEPIEIDPQLLDHVERTKSDRNIFDFLLEIGILIPTPAELPVEEWPKMNDKYWTARFSEILDFTWENDSYDKWNKLVGNCFKTESEAEKFRKDTLKGSK